MSEWYLFLWINEFSPSSFLFIQSWTKISRQIYSGMDIILQNILFCSKGSSRFHKFMFALYHIFSAPLQAMLCGRHTNIIAWKIECLKIWPRHYGLEGEGEVWNKQIKQRDSDMWISEQKHKKSILQYIDCFYFLWDCASSTTTLFQQELLLSIF